MEYTFPATGPYRLKIRHVTQDNRKRISLGAAIGAPDQAYRVWVSERGFILLEPVTEVSVHDSRLTTSTLVEAEHPLTGAPRPDISSAPVTRSAKPAASSAVMATLAPPAAEPSPPPGAGTAPTKARLRTKVSRDSLSIGEV